MVAAAKHTAIVKKRMSKIPVHDAKFEPCTTPRRKFENGGFYKGHDDGDEGTGSLTCFFFCLL